MLKVTMEMRPFSPHKSIYSPKGGVLLTHTPMHTHGGGGIFWTINRFVWRKRSQLISDLQTINMAPKKTLKIKLSKTEAAARRRCPPPPPTQPPEGVAVEDADANVPSASSTATSSEGPPPRRQRSGRPTTPAERAAWRARQQKCRDKDRQQNTHPCNCCYTVCASKGALHQHLAIVHRIDRLHEESWQEVIRGIPK